MLTFYAEWLRLPKEQFRVLVMLADKGAFRGSLADICRYFSVDPQTQNRNRLRTTINELTRHKFIKAVRVCNTYQLSLIPKEKEITMSAEWVARIRRHDYNTESVAWEIVLKVLLWLVEYASGVIVTNDEIAEGVASSASQICAAKNVLKQEYGAFIMEYVYWQTGENGFRRRGQIIDVSAWWE